MQYNHLILGGTFDRLHKGHKKFLQEAFKSSQIITVGLTVDGYDNKKILSAIIEPYNMREKKLKEFARETGFKGVLEIIPLKDIYGNSLVDKDIDAIVVTAAGYQNADLINKKREEIGLTRIAIIKVPFEKDDDGNIISSTRIRIGEIDRQGNIYANLFMQDKTYEIDESLRKELKKPFGKIIKNSSSLPRYNGKFIITIGDVTTSRFIKENVYSDISIIDGFTKRQKIIDKFQLEFLPKSNFNAENLPGTINSRTALLIKKCIARSIDKAEKITINIKGEEDLLTIPAILFSPLNALVFYGLKDKGVVEVAVDEELKQVIINRVISKLTISKG